jgi:flagellar hook-length control protein FliK
MSTQQNQVAELHLNPPNLGPLDVVLKISDNQATALFTSPHGAVRDAVENALPRLREMLADNGITLGNTTVSDQPRDRSADGFSGNGFGTAAQRESSDEASRLAGLSPAAVQPVPMRRHNGMVDTFA